MNLLIILFISLQMFCALAQEAAGIDGADGITKDSRNSSGESENSDSSSKKQKKQRLAIQRLLPAGVQQFGNMYPKTHFRFVTGDLLSSSFFEATGLFPDLIGDDPLEASINRTTSVERHAGLFSFLAVATTGGHAINGIENKIKNRLGIEKTNERITQLKNVAGLHILAGVYAYVAVDLAIKGKSQDEILEILSKKDTFAAAVSMHMAFMGADKFIEFSKKMKNNLALVNQIMKNPRALEIAKQYTSKGGLTLYQELLTNAKKLNNVRKELQKSKIALGIAQPQTIPALVAGTAVEWTAYYVFAKVWDAYIHKSFLSALNWYDQKELKSGLKDVFCYGVDQGDLHYDSTVENAAQVIDENIQQLSALMFAPLMDKQMEISQKLFKAAYLEELHRQYFELQTNEEREEFIISLMKKESKMYELNLEFIKSLYNGVNKNSDQEISHNVFLRALKDYTDAYNPVEKMTVSRLNASAGIRDMKRANKKLYERRLRETIRNLNSAVRQVANEDIFLESLNKKLDRLEVEIEEIQREAQRLNGMSVEGIQASNEKYNLNPETNQFEIESIENMPEPTTVYELIQVQKIYTQLLAGVATSDESKKKVLEMQNKNEFALYLQARNWEDLVNYHQEINKVSQETQSN